MNRSTEIELPPDEIDLNATWTSRTGTFDPVEAGAELAAVGWRNLDDDATGPATGVDDPLADYVERESAYVEPLNPLP